MLNGTRRVFVAAAAVLVGLTAGAAAYGATLFSVENVGPLSGGADVPVAVDARGNPHICYQDASTNDLMYAYKIGEAWFTETIKTGSDVGNFSSIALDASGVPHVGFYNGSSEDVHYAVRENGEWTTELVDSDGYVGWYVSLALDHQGRPHLAYLDTTNDNLKYAVKNGGSWSVTTVDAGGEVGASSSIALDPQGRAHIAYLDRTNENVKYAYKTPEGWNKDTVDSMGGIIGYISVAVGHDGNPHIAYYEETGDDLKHAVRSGTSWITEVVDDTGLVGAYNSIALDADGNPHISYADVGNSCLKYARHTGYSWITQTADGTEYTGQYTSIALDAKGVPHISYCEFLDTDEIRFADASVHLLSPAEGAEWEAGGVGLVRWTGPGAVDVFLSEDGGASYITALSGVGGDSVLVDVPMWDTDVARVKIVGDNPYSESTSEAFSIFPRLEPARFFTSTPDMQNDVMSRTSNALGANDAPHVAYGHVMTHELNYARKAGGSWSDEALPVSGAGTSISLVMDDEDIPHIGYHGYYDGNLMHSYKTGSSWTTETVDASGDVGGGVSLAYSDLSGLYMSYQNDAESSLKCAYNGGGGWTTETVDDANTVNAYTSMALDGEGAPHIVYYDSGNNDLMYATKSGAGWSITRVDEGGDVGLHASVAVSASGTVHVSYYDATNEDLKHAYKVGGLWNIEVADEGGDVGGSSSIALDARGVPHVAYQDYDNDDLKYAYKNGGVWTARAVDSEGNVGRYVSLALDSDGNPRITYGTNQMDLKYASAAIEMRSPSGGTVWPVGALRPVYWDGVGPVDVHLSVDGGASFCRLATDMTEGSWTLTVPHMPSRFCVLKLERECPRSSALSDSFFTIESSISLLAMSVAPAPPGERGVLITWETDPGPEDLAGYRLDRALPEQGAWRTLVDRMKVSSYLDTEGRPEARYRLYAVNGLGEELLLAERRLGPTAPLSAWPVPYEGGELSISFATAGGLGGGAGLAEVALFDAAGRLVRVVGRGMYPAGVQRLTWNGLDDNGRRVPPGVYFLRSSSGGHTKEVKVMIAR
jgi:hypothetical protein